MRPPSGNLGFMNILMSHYKTLFKIRQSKIALKQTLTLKLGVMTVTQVYVYINLHRVTTMPPV